MTDSFFLVFLPVLRCLVTLRKKLSPVLQPLHLLEFWTSNSVNVDYNHILLLEQTEENIALEAGDFWDSFSKRAQMLNSL